MGYKNEWREFKRVAFETGFNRRDIIREMGWTQEKAREFFRENDIPNKGFSAVDLLSVNEFIQLYLECDSDYHMAEILGCRMERISIMKGRLNLMKLDRKNALERRKRENKERIVNMYLDGYSLDEICFETSMHIATVEQILKVEGELHDECEGSGYEIDRRCIG
ncbi:hypothetical protein RY280_23530 [Bacillus paralicheniformis]|uniref:hypothetical protein n=1 Tax=Bacillus paralicheniformis TaxID=1648923 RepID=UPI00203FA983|nr:hypothetical protein [Bacillus paralicheniformis]MCM3425588.1 hypothetical protein [Bacillus paralicheniformis]